MSPWRRGRTCDVDGLVRELRLQSRSEPARHLPGRRDTRGRALHLPRRRDASPPQAQRPCRVPHDLDFVGELRTWGGGVAFLDHEHVAPAPTLGHAYLVTAGQFEDVAAQETGRAHAEVEVAEVRACGSVTLGTGRYDRVVWLGDEDGIPQLTFTSPEPSSAAEPAAPRSARPSPHPGGTGGGARHDGGGECRLPEMLVRRGRALVGGVPDQSGLGRTGIVPMEPRLAPLTREDSL